MSAGNPFTMFCAWVVLPPKDIWKITDCLWVFFQSVAKVPDDEVSLPYASYGLLYAASVRTGDDVFLQEPPAPAEEPLADVQAAAARATVTPKAAPASRERLLIDPSLLHRSGTKSIESIKLVGNVGYSRPPVNADGMPTRRRPPARCQPWAEPRTARCVTEVAYLRPWLQNWPGAG